MALSQFGYYCFCSLQLYLTRQSAREKILEQIPENLLTKISASDNQIKIEWIEEGKELRLNGEMFDVVKMKNEGGEQYIYCINDGQEDYLIKVIEKIVKANTENSPGTGKHNNTAKITIPEWVFELPGSDPLNESTVLGQRKYFNFKSDLYFSYLEINSPPPNFYIN